MHSTCNRDFVGSNPTPGLSVLRHSVLRHCRPSRLREVKECVAAYDASAEAIRVCRASKGCEKTASAWTPARRHLSGRTGARPDRIARRGRIWVRSSRAKAVGRTDGLRIDVRRPSFYYYWLAVKDSRPRVRSCASLRRGGRPRTELDVRPLLRGGEKTLKTPARTAEYGRHKGAIVPPVQLRGDVRLHRGASRPRPRGARPRRELTLLSSGFCGGDCRDRLAISTPASNVG